MTDQDPEKTGGSPAGEETTKVQPPKPAAGAAATAEKHTGRVISARVLVVLATLIAILSIFSAWARKQLLDTNQWTKTSTELLQNQQVRDRVSNYLVDELYTNVNVAQQLQSKLPPDLAPLAPIAAGALRNALDEVADRALANPKIQDAWANSNKVAHEQLVKVIKGGGPNVSTANGEVTLNLRNILTTIADQVGIPSAVVQKIPPSAAQIQILKSDELSQAQDGAKLLNALGLWLGFVALLLYALAVWLAIGRRRQTLLFSGIGLIVAGLVVLIARNLVQADVIDALVPNAAGKPAANAAFVIGTSLLRTLANQAIVLGLAAVIAAWLAGPSRPATALRRGMAPTLRERPEVAYLVMAALYLLLVVWAPIPALRRPLFLLILAVLFGLAVYFLRRQTEEEFPEGAVTAGGPGPLSRAGAAVSGMAGGKVAATGDADADQMAKLERLVALRDGGALDDEEFAAEKAKLLGKGENT